MVSKLIIALLLVASTTPVLVAKPGSSIDNALVYPAYYSSPSNDTDAIINGDFETGDFSGWTTAGSPIITTSDSMIYHGSYSALIDHSTDILWQPLSYPISKYSVFGYVMLGTGSVDDANWHEIRLTITGQALPTIYLHYVLRSTQPADNATDKYFAAYKGSGSWSAANFVLINDLTAKGISQYLGGTVTNITCQEGGVCGTVYDSLYLTEYDPFSNPTPNAIVNGGFEFQNLTGWTLVGTPPYVTIIDYDRNQVYEGFFSAYNHHYYESFYQPLNFKLSYNSTFSGAMFATVSLSDSDWHETRLTITMPGLPALYLHYRVQSNQPVDTSTNKYFLIGTQLDRWYSWDHNLYSDLSEKGVAQYLNGTVVEIMCQQDGVCCTAYDAFELSPSSGSGTKIGSPVFPLVILGVAILFTLVAIAAAISLRSRGSREYGNAPTEPEVIGGGFDEEASSGERSALIPSTEKCARCGASVASHDASYCTNCGARLGALSQSNAASAMRGKPVAIGTCMVCGLKLDDRDAVAKCPKCGSIGHQVHVLEWLHVKGYCPACRRHLDERDLKN